MTEPKIRKFYKSLSRIVTPVEVLEAGGWPGVFGRAAPMDLEIGFGNGEFLARISAERPERDFVGVELAWNSLKRALRRLETPPRRNVRVLRLPALPALERLFEPESLSVVRCYFPVPWPNERQSGKRIFSRRFLDTLANRLAPDGLFHMATDHGGLAEWTLAEAKGSAMALEAAPGRAALDTKYERKWRSAGQESFLHLSGAKIAHPRVDAPGLVEMTPRYSRAIDPGEYRPRGLSGDPAVVFGDFVYDRIRERGLLQAKVVEDQFVQEFFIRLSRQPDGRFKLAPAISGQVLPTAGVSLALALAALEEPAR
jgi:tRNA (guanine-N7-)-methyltransferase